MYFYFLPMSLSLDKLPVNEFRYKTNYYIFKLMWIITF